MSPKSSTEGGVPLPSSPHHTSDNLDFSSDTENSSSALTPLELKSAHKKLDRRLILWYALVYMVMRIHVSNISNTAIINLEQGDGIKAQLGNLSSQQWAWVLSIFYYPYMFFEPLATLALKKFGPRRWIARIMITWVRLVLPVHELFFEDRKLRRDTQGIISMCQGATSNYAGMLACRFFLGAAEAGFYPGVL